MVDAGISELDLPPALEIPGSRLFAVSPTGMVLDLEAYANHTYNSQLSSAE